MVVVVEKQKGLNFRILAPSGDRRAALTTPPLGSLDDGGDGQNYPFVWSIG